MTRRRILLCATGLSPQVVTETVYALVQQGPQHIPHEIHLVSTRGGIQQARLSLLSEEPGWFRRLCRDFDLPPIRFDAGTLHVIKDASGQELEDVRTDADNIAAADAIAELVRDLTAAPDSALHVSIAGGRKTLGFFAGYALSMFGRPQDRLSHVLVSEPYESTPDFFYPTPYPRVIDVGRGTRQRLVDCQMAQVSLADIPFVRLRGELLDDSLLHARVRYSALVKQIQHSVAPRGLTLVRADRSARVGDQVIKLSPSEFAFLLWVIERQQAGRPVTYQSGIDAAQRDAREFLAIYAGLTLDPDDEASRTHDRLKDGMEGGFLSERASNIHAKFKRTLGPRHAEAYRLSRRKAKRGGHTYRLELKPEDIHVVEHPNP